MVLRNQGFLFFSLFARGLWLCGAAVSLSRRRSLRRGTAGHDGFPRALGIMPRHFLRRGIRTHNEFPRALGIMRPHHHTNPVGVTTRKKPWFFGIKAFLFMSLFVRSVWLCGAAVSLSKTKSEKPHVFRKATNMVASRNTWWLLSGIGRRNFTAPVESTAPRPQQKR